MTATRSSATRRRVTTVGAIDGTSEMTPAATAEEKVLEEDAVEPIPLLAGMSSPSRNSLASLIGTGCCWFSLAGADAELADSVPTSILSTATARYDADALLHSHVGAASATSVIRK